MTRYIITYNNMSMGYTPQIEDRDYQTIYIF